ncbi:unnamed protein product [Polarella glacialis]|uniref:Uncharacterized protein n=1 Tax=Polarella glacialis TaxID=89957 RepID=A0A813LMY4_POLGL|nr:unnamed protein product [Polarella glacialis]CAE8733550.1 unnamed protein product [Polarella glacialis]CAE8739344.1 unnamed protein product [Polarella glacialis]
MPDFAGMLCLTELTLGMYRTQAFKIMLLVCASVYCILVSIFRHVLLVAQLNGAYQSVHADMVGHARLNRGRVTLETVPVISRTRCMRWLAALKLDERKDNAGDVGVAGGFQILEPGNANPTNSDELHHFGGSASPAVQWPEEEEEAAEDDRDKFERLDKGILRATRKMGGCQRRGTSKGSSSVGQSSSNSGSDSDEGSEEADGSP